METIEKYYSSISILEDDEQYRLIKMIIVFVVLITVLFAIKIFKIKLNIGSLENWDNITKKYDLSIMTIFKNEQDYMEEWLDHHITQGFNQIFMYCNDTNIQNYPFLFTNKYKKYITVIDWTDKLNKGPNTIQRQAYTHCVKNFSHLTQFLLMLDLDEFVILTEQKLTSKLTPKVSDWVCQLKSKWNTIKALKIQRYDFGSNGHKSKPSGQVMANYKKHEKICSSYKTMGNTDFIDKSLGFYGVHDFNFTNKPGKIFNDYFGYHETGFPNSCKKNSINEIPLVINHYYTKSYEEYLARCQLWEKGGINPIGHRKDCENKFASRDVNEVEGYVTS
jgi:hypothetical protein